MQGEMMLAMFCGYSLGGEWSMLWTMPKSESSPTSPSLAQYHYGTNITPSYVFALSENQDIWSWWQEPCYLKLCICKAFITVGLLSPIWVPSTTAWNKNNYIATGRNRGVKWSKDLIHATLQQFLLTTQFRGGHFILEWFDYLVVINNTSVYL